MKAKKPEKLHANMKMACRWVLMWGKAAANEFRIIIQPFFWLQFFRWWFDYDGRGATFLVVIV